MAEVASVAIEAMPSAAVCQRSGASITGGSERRHSHHDHHRMRRRHHRHSYGAADTSELRSAALGSNIGAGLIAGRSTDRGTMTDHHQTHTDLPPGRRGAIRRRHSAATVAHNRPDILHPRHLYLNDDLFADRPAAGGAVAAAGDAIDAAGGLDDGLAWDAGRFVAVIRQRRDLFFGMTDDDLLNVLIADDGPGNGERPEPTYPIGEAQYAECIVCLEYKNLHTRICCGIAACDDCLRQYVTTQVSQAIIKIECIGGTCDTSIHRDEILARLDGVDKPRYVQLLIDANVDPLRRTCPRCNHIAAVTAADLATAGRLGLAVACSECELRWCFPCHAPWHDGMRCTDFRRGDKLLKAWAREQHFGQVNAQKCPKCKFYIQRSSGCDHMTCSRCKTDFCYRCGERFRELKFVGNHYSKLSIFGCKYRFKPTQPVQRRLIRGSIFAAQLLAVPALAALAVGAGAVVASVGSLVLPFYAGYKLHKRLERRRSAKRRRRAREAMWHKLEDMRWRGEELDISHPMLTELDTTQIIRSFIGVGIDITAGGGGGANGSVSATGLDGSAMDDAASTTDDGRSVAGADGGTSVGCDACDSSSDSDDFDGIDYDDVYEDGGDDFLLRIRDEACQTGDGDDSGSDGAGPSGYRTVVARKESATQLGYGDIIESTGASGSGGTVDAAAVMSPWAALLHRSDDDDDEAVVTQIATVCSRTRIGEKAGKEMQQLLDDVAVRGTVDGKSAQRQFWRSRSETELPCLAAVSSVVKKWTSDERVDGQRCTEDASDTQRCHGNLHFGVVAVTGIVANDNSAECQPVESTTTADSLEITIDGSSCDGGGICFQQPDFVTRL